MRRSLSGGLALVLLLGFAPAASACPVCYGAPDEPMVLAVNKGIWVLLALVALVQAGFIAMFWSFWRRAREQRRFRESFHIVRSSEEGGAHS